MAEKPAGKYIVLEAGTALRLADLVSQKLQNGEGWRLVGGVAVSGIQYAQALDRN